MKKLVDDKGMEEYPLVKEAQKELKVHLDRIADLKAYIAGHKLGAEWLRLEDKDKFDATQKAVDDALAESNPCLLIKPEYIIDSIESRIGKDGELYKAGIWEADLWTYPNASMALYFALTGKKEKAERIMSGIESGIGKDGELYKAGVGDAGLWAYPNASMALYFALTGKKEKAERIVAGIESRIGKDGELYKAGVGDAGLRTHSNASMALYLTVKEGARMEAR